MTAYAYLRKSSVRPGVRDMSHEVQESAVREMAARHGDGDRLTILSDWDRSGRLGPDKRPGYAALLAAIASGQVRTIYSYSLSRLARSVKELSRLVDDCVQRDIAVRLYADAIDTSTATGRLTTHVLSALAAFEADVASERTRAAYEAKRVAGERVGTTPFYGDRPGEDLDAVMAAFDEAGSYSGAARLLNQRGIQTRTGKRGWWPSSVSTIVERVRPVKRTSKGVKAAGTDFILARLMRCPTCGTLLTGIRDRGERVRYACRLGSVRPHPRVTVTEKHILPAVQAEVARLRTPERVQVAEQDRAARVQVEGRRQRILQLFEDGDIDRDEKTRRLASVERELVKIEVATEILDIPAIDWTWPPRALNAVLRALFDHIELDPATFQPVAFEWSVPEWRA